MTSLVQKMYPYPQITFSFFLALCTTAAAATRLHPLVRANDLPGVEAALQKAGPPLAGEIVGPGVTPLHVAAALDFSEMTALLVSYGAPINAQTQSGFTPLHWAAGRNAANATERLLRLGADINAQSLAGVTPLHWAALNNASNVVRLLIRNEAQLDARTVMGMEPLHWAVMRQSDAAAEMLAYRLIEDRMVSEAAPGGHASTHTAPASALTSSPAPDTVVPPPQPEHITNAAGMEPTAWRPDVPLSIPLGQGRMMEFIWLPQLGMWFGKYEVTNDQFRRFRPRHRSLFREDFSLDLPEQPVVFVSWHDAAEYCAWLNRNFRDRLPPGYVFRLPRSVEWEAMARCGDDRIWPWGNEWPPAFGNFPDQTSKHQIDQWQGFDDYRDGHVVTCPVPASGRNDWGIFGVAGNVSEWCDDWNPPEQRHKIRKGGSWDFETRESVTVAWNGLDRPSVRDDTIGFRVVIAPPIDTP